MRGSSRIQEMAFPETISIVGRHHDMFGTHFSLKKSEKDRFLLTLRICPAHVEALGLEDRHKCFLGFVRQAALQDDPTLHAEAEAHDRVIRNSQKILVFGRTPSSHTFQGTPQVRVGKLGWGTWVKTLSTATVEKVLFADGLKELLVPGIEVKTTTHGNKVLLIDPPGDLTWKKDVLDTNSSDDKVEVDSSEGSPPGQDDPGSSPEKGADDSELDDEVAADPE